MPRLAITLDRRSKNFENDHTDLCRTCAAKIKTVDDVFKLGILSRNILDESLTMTDVTNDVADFVKGGGCEHPQYDGDYGVYNCAICRKVLKEQDE